MALNANRLGDAMLTAVNAVSTKTDRQALFRAMAAAIIAEFQVNGTVVVVSVSGVTTGPGVSGPGTGTIA